MEALKQLFIVHLPQIRVPKDKPITTMRDLLYQHGVISSPTLGYKILKEQPVFPEIEDVVSDILINLSISDIDNVITVNKQWCRVISTPMFWKCAFATQVQVALPYPTRIYPGIPRHPSHLGSLIMKWNKPILLPSADYKLACTELFQSYNMLSTIKVCIARGWVDAFEYVLVYGTHRHFLVTNMTPISDLVIGTPDNSFMARLLSIIKEYTTDPELAALNVNVPKIFFRNLSRKSEMWDRETQHTKLALIVQSGLFSTPDIYIISMVCATVSSLKVFETFRSTLASTNTSNVPKLLRDAETNESDDEVDDQTHMYDMVEDIDGYDDDNFHFGDDIDYCHLTYFACDHGYIDLLTYILESKAFKIVDPEDRLDLLHTTHTLEIIRFLDRRCSYTDGELNLRIANCSRKKDNIEILDYLMGRVSEVSDDAEMSIINSNNMEWLDLLIKYKPELSEHVDLTRRPSFEFVEKALNHGCCVYGTSSGAKDQKIATLLVDRGYHVPRRDVLNTSILTDDVNLYRYGTGGRTKPNYYRIAYQTLKLGNINVFQEAINHLNVENLSQLSDHIKDLVNEEKKCVVIKIFVEHSALDQAHTVTIFFDSLAKQHYKAAEMLTDVKLPPGYTEILAKLTN